MILLNVQDWHVYFADWWYGVKLELTMLFPFKDFTIENFDR